MILGLGFRDCYLWGTAFAGLKCAHIASKAACDKIVEKQWIKNQLLLALAGALVGTLAATASTVLLVSVAGSGPSPLYDLDKLVPITIALIGGVLIGATTGWRSSGSSNS